MSSAWSSVSLQVGWKLEECTKPSEDEIVASGEHAGEQREDLQIAANTTELSDHESDQANSSDILPAANSGTTDSATPGNSESFHD